MTQTATNKSPIQADSLTRVDYQPIKNLKIPGVDIKPQGLILVVGPNSSGKTQLLKDIHALLSGEQRKYVVCEEITIDKPANLNGLLEEMESSGYMTRYRNRDGGEYFKPTSPQLGIGPAKVGETYMPQLSSAFNALKAGPYDIQNNPSAPFFSMLGHSLVTALFLDRRLTMANETSSFDYEKMSPTNEIQSLYINETAGSELSREIREVFGKGIWIDASRSNILCLRINQLPDIPSADDRLQPQKVRQYRTIESEGDGLRSYVGITLSLLLGLRPVCLIDEPELCLHPPQAYSMGRFIGSHGANQTKVIFASSHSSHVLRGVIEVTNNVQILRMTKYDNRFKGHLIDAESLRECMKHPIVRAETILDGIFADGVALVEADGDRAVYQAAWEKVTQGRPHRDILFIPVGGTGGFAEIASFYHRLKIPVAVVADLDLLADPDKLSRILKAISINREQARGIIDKCHNVSQKLKEMPPKIAPDSVRQRLLFLADGPIDWSPKIDEPDDVRLRKALNVLAKELDRLRQMKAGGIEGLKEDDSLYNTVNEIVEECKSLGIFLVPVGEVEQWEPKGMDQAPSQKRKAEWANWAASEIRNDSTKWSNLLQFISNLESFESNEAKRIINE